MNETPGADGRCRIAFVGCGRATTELHLPALAGVAEVSVVAVCDVDGDAARSAAARFGIDAVYGDVAALLARDDLDAVAVCVPPAHHAAAAHAVLDSGRHLFLEKPLAPTREACDDLVAHATRAGRVAAIGFNLRQHRLVRAARDDIRAGATGRIDLVRSSFTSDIALRRDLPAWRRARDQGGGVLFELGVHHFDLWRWLTGLEFVEIFAYRRGAGDHDRSAVVMARAADGTLASAQLDEATHAGNELEILGDAGRMRISLYEFDGLRTVSAAAPPGGIGGRVEGVRHTLAALPAALRGIRRGGDYLATFETEWRRFADAVLHGAPPAASLEDGRAATRMSIAAAESIESGQPVRI